MPFPPLSHSIILADAREEEPDACCVCRIAWETWTAEFGRHRTHLTRHHLMQVQSGAGEVELNGQRLPLRPGDLFAHGPLTWRCYFPQDSVDILHISIGGTGVAPSIEAAFGRLPRVLSLGHHPDLDWFLERLQSVARERAAEAETYADQLMRALLLAIRRGRLRTPGAASPAEATFVRIQQQIRRDLFEIEDLETLAARCHVSPSYLCRLFRRFAGCSPLQWWRRQQMQEACEWLSEEGLSVKQAAARLRFSDEAAFSKAFKRVIGDAPSRYRQRA